MHSGAFDTAARTAQVHRRQRSVLLQQHSERIRACRPDVVSCACGHRYVQPQVLDTSNIETQANLENTKHILVTLRSRNTTPRNTNTSTNRYKIFFCKM